MAAFVASYHAVTAERFQYRAMEAVKHAIKRDIPNMSKWLIVVSIMLGSPAIAADAQTRPPSSGPWSAQEGESDTLHGIWVVNSATGTVYRCAQFAGVPTCIE